MPFLVVISLSGFLFPFLFAFLVRGPKNLDGRRSGGCHNTGNSEVMVIWV